MPTGTQPGHQCCQSPPSVAVVEAVKVDHLNVSARGSGVRQRPIDPGTKQQEFGVHGSLAQRRASPLQTLQVAEPKGLAGLRLADGADGPCGSNGTIEGLEGPLFSNRVFHADDGPGGDRPVGDRSEDAVVQPRPGASPHYERKIVLVAHSIAVTRRWIRPRDAAGRAATWPPPLPRHQWIQPP